MKSTLSAEELDQFRAVVTARLTELGVRMHDIETELEVPKSSDSNDQAIDLEDDEVLEGLGLAAQKETALLQYALGRIKDGSFGTCLECAGRISDERLNAVPYAMICKKCMPSKR